MDRRLHITEAQSGSFWRSAQSTKNAISKPTEHECKIPFNDMFKTLSTKLSLTVQQVIDLTNHVEMHPIKIAFCHLPY